MRIIRLIITSLAVLIGLLVAAVFMAIGLLVFAIRRLFGQPAKMPVFRHTMHRPNAGAQSGGTRTSSRLDNDDVIDVVATEVKD